VETDKLIDLSALQHKSATFVWEFMFTRSMYQTADMIEQHNILNRLADLIDAKKLQSTLTKKLTPITAENLRRAHAIVEKGNMIGKIVLEQFPD
jgi:NADPH:quinone reductase-like Zn-dependent oxidoreductase